ncbi:MAG: SPOR domain-containing protein [Bacteroidota bacterium]
MITKHIADLLYHHECVIVPGLGGFIKACGPARIVHPEHKFFPPSGTVVFNAGLSGNDGQLANYLASSENMSYREAIYEIKLWVEKCFDALRKGEIVRVEGIGELFLNTSDKIEFAPLQEVNFNADSFGLPVFVAKVDESRFVSLPEIQPSKRAGLGSKLRRWIPETMKWAAILSPFVAFIIWGSLNSKVINNYVHNYTGMYPWGSSTSVVKTPAKKAVELPKPVKETDAEFMQSPAEILDDINKPSAPVLQSEPANTITSKPATDQDVVSKAVVPVSMFHVVGGAFRDRNNALKLISSLQEQGYAATIVDTTAGGLYVVSMKGAVTYEDAVIQLRLIKDAGFTASWILKKQKG